jgi:hypothetical protein
MPPPKQVYGKRAPAATAAFAKFIPPDQDVVVVCEQQKKKKRDPVKTRGKERDVHGEEKGEDAEELEVGLGALTIANEDADVEKGAGKSRRAERGTRRLEARNAEKLSKESLKRRNGPVDAINLTDSTASRSGKKCAKAEGPTKLQRVLPKQRKRTKSKWKHDNKEQDRSNMHSSKRRSHFRFGVRSEPSLYPDAQRHPRCRCFLRQTKLRSQKIVTPPTSRLYCP